MTLNPMKSRKVLVLYIVLFIILLAVVSILTICNLSKKSDQGPLFSMTGLQKEESTTATQIAPPRTDVVLGGFPIRAKEKSITIQSISLANVPSGIKIGDTGMIISDPEFVITKKSWFRRLTKQKVHSLPMAINSGKEYWIPLVNVIPLKAGTFVIHGLLINYSIGHKHYQDYFRDQFVICTEKGTAACKEPPPPPMNP